VDAGGDACGGSPSDEDKVIALMNAAYSLKTTVAMVHHEHKNADDKHTSFHGSNYWRNRSRVMWRLIVESEKNANEKTIKLKLEKANNMGKLPPLYYNQGIFAEADPFFNEEPCFKMEICPEGGDVDSTKEAKILKVLESDSATLNQIIELTGFKRGTAQNLLAKLKASGVVKEDRPKDTKKPIIYYIK